MALGEDGDAIGLGPAGSLVTGRIDDEGAEAGCPVLG
jgi:hypothetical protein